METMDQNIVAHLPTPSRTPFIIRACYGTWAERVPFGRCWYLTERQCDRCLQPCCHRHMRKVFKAFAHSALIIIRLGNHTVLCKSWAATMCFARVCCAMHGHLRSAVGHLQSAVGQLPALCCIMHGRPQCAVGHPQCAVEQPPADMGMHDVQANGRWHYAHSPPWGSRWDWLCYSCEPINVEQEGDFHMVPLIVID